MIILHYFQKNILSIKDSSLNIILGTKNKRGIIMDIILIILGIMIIADGALSILYQLRDPQIFQVGRILRIGLGFFLILYAMDLFIFA